MIRPRPGDFLYSDAELRVMTDDIEAFRDAGAEGVVLGVLKRDGKIDLDQTARCVPQRPRYIRVWFTRRIPADWCSGSRRRRGRCKVLSFLRREPALAFLDGPRVCFHRAFDMSSQDVLSGEAAPLNARRGRRADVS